MRVKCHPSLGILVCTDGHVMVPANGSKKAHWTFGSKNERGYLSVMINGKHYRVHRLVAQTFIGPIPDGYEVDHIDRDRSNNAVNNIRITTHSQNNRNTSHNDRVDARGGTHWYENEKQYWKEKNAEHRKTHKNVYFSDGKRRWLPNSEALELCKLPVKERTWPR